MDPSILVAIPAGSNSRTMTDLPETSCITGDVISVQAGTGGGRSAGSECNNGTSLMVQHHHGPLPHSPTDAASSLLAAASSSVQSPSQPLPPSLPMQQQLFMDPQSQMQKHPDDDLGFDPYAESSKGLADLLNEERRAQETTHHHHAGYYSGCGGISGSLLVSAGVSTHESGGYYHPTVTSSPNCFLPTNRHIGRGTSGQAGPPSGPPPPSVPGIPPSDPAILAVSRQPPHNHLRALMQQGGSYNPQRFCAGGGNNRADENPRSFPTAIPGSGVQPFEQTTGSSFENANGAANFQHAQPHTDRNNFFPTRSLNNLHDYVEDSNGFRAPPHQQHQLYHPPTLPPPLNGAPPPPPPHGRHPPPPPPHQQALPPHHPPPGTAIMHHPPPRFMTSAPPPSHPPPPTGGGGPPGSMAAPPPPPHPAAMYNAGGSHHHSTMMPPQRLPTNNCLSSATADFGNGTYLGTTGLTAGPAGVNGIPGPPPSVNQPPPVPPPPPHQPGQPTTPSGSIHHSQLSPSHLIHHNGTALPPTTVGPPPPNHHHLWLDGVSGNNSGGHQHHSSVLYADSIGPPLWPLPGDGIRGSSSSGDINSVSMPPGATGGSTVVPAAGQVAFS